MTSLVVVKELTFLTNKGGKLLDGVPLLPPNLEVLQLGALAWDSYEPEAQLHLSDLIPMLQHPTLRLLKIIAAAVIATGETFGELPASVPSATVSKITSLQLSQVRLQPSTLADITNHVGRLTSFVFTRSPANLPSDSIWSTGQDDKAKCISLHHLGLALQQSQDSVEAVEITYADEARWLDEVSVLDFKAYSKLKSLTIDPSIILGRRVCPFQSEGPRKFDHYSPPSALETRLPGSLEKLELAIAPEQALRIPNYRKDMLQSLLSNKTAFPDLRQITLYDIRSTQAELQCRCERERPSNPRICPRTSRFRYPEYDSRSPFEEPRAIDNKEHLVEYIELREAFQKVDVLLSFMEDEVEYQYESETDDSEEEIEWVPTVYDSRCDNGVWRDGFCRVVPEVRQA